MATVYHYTRKEHLAPMLTHGLHPSARFHHLGLEMRRNVVYCWPAPEDDRMGYRQDPALTCIAATVEPERCVVADMDLATLAYQYMRGLGGKPQDPASAKHYAGRYASTAVPLERYAPGMFETPEVLVKGPIEAGHLHLDPSYCTPAFAYTRGQRIRITAMRYDGTPYRWWDAAVETVTPDCVVTWAPAGGTVYQPDGSWQPRISMRAYYWTDRMYNLGEFYHPNREQSGLYVHIASQPQFSSGEICYHDHELDVLKYVGQDPKVVDEDDFVQAAQRYGYSPEFQASCRSAVDDALRLTQAWIWPYAKDVGATRRI